MSTHAQAPAAVELSKAADEKKYPARMPRHGNASTYRRVVIGLLAIAVLAPVGLIIYQSFLTAAFFSPRAKFGFDAYRYVFSDKNFYKALGTTAIFSVEDVGQYPKSDFPTDDVYGTVDHAALRLITCGGFFDGETGHHVDNVVVYAKLVGSR